MTLTDLIVLLLSAGGVCWFFHARRRKLAPHRYTSDAQPSAEEQK